MGKAAEISTDDVHLDEVNGYVYLIQEISKHVGFQLCDIITSMDYWHSNSHNYVG